MRRTIMTAALGGLIAATAFTLPAQSAEKAAGVTQTGEFSSQQRATKRPPARARITVNRRSYLNTGTESMPGDHKYHDYAFPPGYSVTSAIDRTNAFPNEGLPGPFDLPSRRNPRQFSINGF